MASSESGLPRPSQQRPPTQGCRFRSEESVVVACAEIGNQRQKVVIESSGVESMAGQLAIGVVMALEYRCGGVRRVD
ncbi:hypothetical protein Q31b_58530 [Novipirellula aureliae]|uniref:Uncharacterized protein n=1 Tax=Novipirellula aureliae TaxID=2527966 RepID=A0A5C6D5H1_9BACT|nr:hypothetical protein Q31b_58530 [Novipirellula aureliae]